jgi:hypothetical protein
MSACTPERSSSAAVTGKPEETARLSSRYGSVLKCHQSSHDERLPIALVEGPGTGPGEGIPVDGPDPDGPHGPVGTPGAPGL